MHVALQEAVTGLPGLRGERFVERLRHGSLSVELYAPQGRDLQQPHTRDEVYVVVRGHGHFRNGENVHPFAAGDVLFVPAGRVHRFEDFSNDFMTWVLFYGPDGGETP
jgi:mannose-6-phosphate isomerase-like protein (cupin superfamily)